MPFPAPMPHDPLTEIFPDVYLVRGSFRMGPGMVIPRNMVVLRQGEELAVVSAVRLSAPAEQELDRLGTVRHVIKIGAFHGIDNPYYVDRYRAKLWALPGHQHAGGLQTDELLREDGPMPLAGLSLFVYRQAAAPEAALLWQRDGGLLITCDSVQHWTDKTYCTLPAKIVMAAMGFFKPANIGPGWLKQARPKGGASLAEDFHRLLALPFSHLVGGHGSLLRDSAHEALAATVERMRRRL